MGSRLVIALSEVLCIPEVVTTLKTELIEGTVDDTTVTNTVAEVRMVSPFKDRPEDFVFVFDVDTYEGKQSLSMDFNFFRYSVLDDKHKLLRLLYEYSICFRVVH